MHALGGSCFTLYAIQFAAHQPAWLAIHPEGGVGAAACCRDASRIHDAVNASGGIGGHFGQHSGDLGCQRGIIGPGQTDGGAATGHPRDRVPAGDGAPIRSQPDQPGLDERLEQIGGAGRGRKTVIGNDHHRRLRVDGAGRSHQLANGRIDTHQHGPGGG